MNHISDISSFKVLLCHLISQRIRKDFIVEAHCSASTQREQVLNVYPENVQNLREKNKFSSQAKMNLYYLYG